MNEWFYDGLDEWELRQVLHSEMVHVPWVKPVIRSMKDWQMIETPMTKDDVLDTMLWIRKLP